MSVQIIGGYVSVDDFDDEPVLARTVYQGRPRCREICDAEICDPTRCTEVCDGLEDDWWPKSPHPPAICPQDREEMKLLTYRARRDERVTLVIDQMT